MKIIGRLIFYLKGDKLLKKFCIRYKESILKNLASSKFISSIFLSPVVCHYRHISWKRRDDPAFIKFIGTIRLRRRASAGDTFLTFPSSIARKKKKLSRLTSAVVNRPLVVHRRKSFDREEWTLKVTASVPSIHLFRGEEPRPLLHVTAIPRLITSNQLLVLPFSFFPAKGVSTVSSRWSHRLLRLPWWTPKNVEKERGGTRKSRKKG